MSKNTFIIKIINEVDFFKHYLVQSVVINDSQETFLLLSNKKILDTESLRMYLIDNALNVYTNKEITSLIIKIDACISMYQRYKLLSIENTSCEYNYEGKGRALVFGRTKYTIVIKGAFWKSDKKEFDERISEFKYLNHFSIGGLILRLNQIKDILALEILSQNEDIISANNDEKTLINSTKLTLNNSIEASAINTKIIFDANHFNQKAYELFLYLVDNYKKDGKIKYINIFEFMRKGIDKKKYVFRFTQKDYKAFIISNYDVEIKKYQVAEFLYEDVEKGILNSHEQQFDGR